MNTPRDFRISQIYYMRREGIVDKADIGKIVHKTPKEMIEYHLSLLGFRYEFK